MSRLRTPSLSHEARVAPLGATWSVCPRLDPRLCPRSLPEFLALELLASRWSSREVVALRREWRDGRGEF